MIFRYFLKDRLVISLASITRLMGLSKNKVFYMVCKVQIPCMICKVLFVSFIWFVTGVFVYSIFDETTDITIVVSY